MSRHSLFPLMVLALSQGAHAQLAPSFAQQPPTAGTLLQQIPPAPVPVEAAPRFDAQPSPAPAMAGQDTATLVVKRLTITGAAAYSEADLLAVAGFVPGREMSLPELRQMAARITDHYRRHGYFVAQAYLPAQDVQNGTVTIVVLEGQYGQVTLNNTSRVGDGLANSLLSGLDRGDPITSQPLETRLLLLSDLPGVTVQSTLTPGSVAGTSDLQVDLMPGRRVTGSVDADNAGNRYTGANRIGATIQLNELIGQGDVASLRAVTSGPGLTYVIGAYQLQFGRARVGLSYSYLDYSLIREFKSLESSGTAKVASVFGSYPLIRSRDTNVNVGLAYNAKTFQDRVDTAAFVSDKTVNAGVATLYGDHRDSLGGGGLAATPSA